MNERENKPDQAQGLYRKYEVKRVNDPAGKHADCTYYVLDLDHDPHSVAALEAYAESCKEQYPTLAFDLRHTAAAMARKLGVTPRSAIGPKWIAIAEREPPVKELVLVLHDGRKITKQAAPEQPTVGIGWRDDYPNPKWCVCKNRLYMYFGCLWPDADSIATWGEVTHWMALPKGPTDDTAQKP